ncbi:hypothetical protein GCM10020358_70210 [Amorphoplanes nipponensis]|uniref:Uncharacterized protein n=1 Tax=Actinoplanes nipponensis TaxID=135950 RepID=A0A919JIG9_9ACTN|nr:hypothetical protein [Actinoplanes nipponensis]GIE51146.1 hypothetical protein Ani05nite_46800 [Actinoplanes nipponensis]
MISRPSQRWQRSVAEQEAAVAAGTLPRDQAYAAQLWPAEATAAIDAVLAAYEREIQSLPAVTDEAVWAAVERVVLALNAVDEESAVIETGEREDLCEYIDAVLTEAGVDVAALTGRRDLHRGELTDGWRDW